LKIIVRVLAEAQAPLLDRELIKTENVFIEQITNNILKELDRNSPYNRKWRSFKGEKLTHLDKSWKKKKRGYGLRISTLCHMPAGWQKERVSMVPEVLRSPQSNRRLSSFITRSSTDG